MKARIKRIDKSLPLPIYQTKGSVGFDIFCREETVIKPKEIALIPGNIIVEAPEGYMLLIALRSSTPRKHGLIKPHGIGIIDNDYCGDNDEIKVQVYNHTDRDAIIRKGDRIAQGVFVKIGKFDWEEKETMGKSRGGFGSTG
ncbi:dUTP diphosphatase [Candidatus Woesearchaeota archaeon]|nr:dUTP diphosphatase [Candidatus Woesearchaeota archaeon]